MNIEVVWSKLKQYEGENFYTKTGKSYVYAICGNSLIIKNRKNAITTKASIEKALTIRNPELKDLNYVGIKRANSYIYGIITDERIKSL